MKQNLIEVVINLQFHYTIGFVLFIFWMIYNQDTIQIIDSMFTRIIWTVSGLSVMNYMKFICKSKQNPIIFNLQNNFLFSSKPVR